MTDLQACLDTPHVSETATQLIKQRAPVEVADQQFACVIILGPHGSRQYAPTFALNILGCFASVEACKAHISKLRKVGYDSYDIYIMQLYNFAPIPPPTDAVTAEYAQERLNGLFENWRLKSNAGSTAIERRVESSRMESEFLSAQAKAVKDHEAPDAETSLNAETSSTDSAGVLAAEIQATKSFAYQLPVQSNEFVK